LKNIMSHLDQIQKLLELQPFGLILDMDGTIAEIAPTAEEVRVNPGCKKHLRSLSRRLPLVAIISGRAAKLVRQMVGVAGVVYYGNHGLEWWRRGRLEVRAEAKGYVEKTAAIIREMEPALLPLGVSFENKGAGMVFHYRALPDRERIRQTILELVSRSALAQEFRLDVARAVIELRPPLDVNKGSVVGGLVADYGLRAALYLGDDVADIDAFDTLRRLSGGAAFQGFGLGVVGEETPPEVAQRAHFLLRGVVEVERFLGWMEANLPPR
jgi:trehalose 6-phosphate phosphatase